MLLAYVGCLLALLSLSIPVSVFCYLGKTQ